MAETRGIRNNNPFNIKRSSSRWLGKIPFNESSDKTFEQFTDIDYGLRAGIILLRNYIRQGYNTYSKIISRFAPYSENDSCTYIAYVSNNYAFDPHKPFEFNSDYFIHLVRKICYYESRFNLSSDLYFTILHKFNL